MGAIQYFVNDQPMTIDRTLTNDREEEDNLRDEWENFGYSLGK